MQIYKEGQGTWSRTITLIVSVAIGALMAKQLHGYFSGDIAPYVASGAVLVVFAGIGGYLCFFNEKIGQYLIETQTELKKVSWSPWGEVVNATGVVLVTVIVMGALLYGFDQALVLVLRLAGVY